MPLISVIIPAYNAEKYLSKCIKSIQNNSYKNLEIIIVNDGSKDNTYEVAESFLDDKRIVLINQENGGVSIARNTGIDNAKGEYIAFIDSDDYVSVDYFEKLITVAAEDDTDITACRHICVNEKEKLVLDPFSNIKTDITYTAQDIANNYFSLVTGVINSCCTKLYKRKLIGDTRFSASLKWGEDASFNLECFKKMKKMKVLPDKNYFYLLYDGQTITKKIKGYGVMLIEYVGNINGFLNYYNAYENVKIRKGMGGRCLSDFFTVATHSFNLKEYKETFFIFKKTDWYKFISEIKPKNKFWRVIHKLVLNNKYAFAYFINRIFNLLVKIKRIIKKCQ